MAAAAAAAGAAGAAALQNNLDKFTLSEIMPMQRTTDKL
jgi:hypothetical protein